MQKDFITATPDSGGGTGTVNVTAAANSASSDRSTSITISGGGITRTIPITQKAVEARLYPIIDIGRSMKTQGIPFDSTITTNIDPTKGKIAAGPDDNYTYYPIDDVKIPWDPKIAQYLILVEEGLTGAGANIQWSVTPDIYVPAASLADAFTTVSFMSMEANQYFSVFDYFMEIVYNLNQYVSKRFNLRLQIADFTEIQKRQLREMKTNSQFFMTVA